MADNATKPSIGFGFLFMAMGLAMMVMMAVSQEGLNVPLWVAEIAAAAFFFAGVAITAQMQYWVRLQRIASLLVVYCLAVPGLWIMLGPDTGSCPGAIGFISREAGSMECRIVFGVGGILTLGAAIIMTVIALRKPTGGTGT